MCMCMGVVGPEAPLGTTGGTQQWGRDTQNMEIAPKGQVGRHQRPVLFYHFFLNLF